MYMDVFHDNRYICNSDCAYTHTYGACMYWPAVNSVPASWAVLRNSSSLLSSVTDWRFNRPHSYPSSISLLCSYIRVFMYTSRISWNQYT
jgi:hypothetical protein